MTTQTEIRPATTDDLPSLLQLMAEFYQESGFQLRHDRAEQAFQELLANPTFGAVWLVVAGQEPAGYVVLTLGFSMEYGGRDGFVDDLFIRSRHRGAGLGKAALAAVRARCELDGVRALHLEVGRGNTATQRLYAGFGFQDNDRQLLTLRLADPAHAA